MSRESTAVLFAAAVCAAAWIALPASAEEIVLESVRDNTLIESADGSTSNGAATLVFSGRTAAPMNGIRRALLAFDVAGAVAPGATIQSATLELAKQLGMGAQTLALHRVLADWGEAGSAGIGGGGAPAETGDATWLHTFYDSAFWAAPGGDFVSQPSATALVDSSAPSFATWSGAGLTADVQAWVDDPEAQFGWILIGNESIVLTSQAFGSREQTIAANRPQLTIVYVPEPNTANLHGAAVMTLLVAGVAIRSRERRRPTMKRRERCIVSAAT